MCPIRFYICTITCVFARVDVSFYDHNATLYDKKINSWYMKTITERADQSYMNSPNGASVTAVSAFKFIKR